MADTYKSLAFNGAYCVVKENELGGKTVLAQGMTKREANAHAKELRETPMTPKRRKSERIIALQQYNNPIL